MVEHVTAHVCREHFPISSLTAPALDTLLHLLESPPSCCNARRLHSAYRNRPAAPSLAPPSHSLLQRDPFFPTFPLALPPDVYHSPPLSVALAATATSEKTLALQRRARPLVRRLPPTSATCSPHPTLPPHMSTHPCPLSVPEATSLVGRRYIPPRQALYAISRTWSPPPTATFPAMAGTALLPPS